MAEKDWKEQVAFVTIGGKPVRSSRFCPRTCPHCGSDPYLGSVRPPNTPRPPRDHNPMAGYCLACGRDPLLPEPTDLPALVAQIRKGLLESPTGLHPMTQQKVESLAKQLCHLLEKKP